MSLVDYASSSSDDEDEPAGREEAPNNANLVLPQPNHTKLVPTKLPDASMLLNLPSLPSNTTGVYDHTSKVAIAQNESRKRDFNQSPASYRHEKIPRRNLPHSKTASGLLSPPQLSGRSNVVTEDINKLFTRRNGSEPQSSRAPSES